MAIKTHSILLAGVAVLAIGVGSAGAWTAHRAIESLKLAQTDALVWKAKAARLQEELDARPVLVKCEVGRDGTLSRKARNYVNVKAPSDRYWRGQTGRDKHGHAIFESPEWSLRAGAIVLKNYSKRHGLNTVEGIVKRFSTCNHEEYISFLCKRLHLRPDEKFNVVARMPELLPAMVKFETGAKVRPEHMAILDYLKES